MSGEYSSDNANRINSNCTNEDDFSSDNESWSSYDNLPTEDFKKNEDDECSENVSNM